MNVIMLDLDGVTHNAKSIRIASDTQAPADPACIAALNRLTNTIQAKLVISSSWRRSLGLEELSGLAKFWGIQAPIIGCTPYLPEAEQRGDEIAAWLETQKPHTVKFLILDDGSDMGALGRHLCKTTWHLGLTEEDVDLAIKVWKLLYEA